MGRGDPSEHAHERAALNFPREPPPDREPFRAWSNFTFQAEDGRRYEVELLVITPTEVFLVEIKSHPNRMDGDAGSWIWTRPDGSRQTFDNPLADADRQPSPTRPRSSCSTSTTSNNSTTRTATTPAMAS